MTDIETMHLPVDAGVTLHARRWPAAGGEQQPMLLVHGLASNARMWDGVGDALARLGHEVVAVDLRGHGQSDKPDTGYDFETVTADLLGVIRGLGWARPVVVGQSWGGNVVVELAARAPEAVRGVAGVDGGAIDLSARYPTWEEAAERLRPPALAGTPAADLEARFRAAHPDWPESGIRGMLANFEVRPDGTVAPWLTLPRHMAILRSLWEQRPLETLAAVRVPVVLVGAASGDAAADAATRAALERASRVLRRGRVAEMAGEHDLHAQHPEAVAALLHGAVAEGFL